jgi:hypothetical protein
MYVINNLDLEQKLNVKPEPEQKKTIIWIHNTLSGLFIC